MKDGLVSRLTSSLDSHMNKRQSAKANGEKKKQQGVNDGLVQNRTPIPTPAVHAVKSALNLSTSLADLIKKKAVDTKTATPVISQAPVMPSQSTKRPHERQPISTDDDSAAKPPLMKKARGNSISPTGSKKQKRQIRFTLSAQEEEDGSGWMKRWIVWLVGTCQSIEKDYFRLTSQPHPSTVRPPHVLIKSLANVKARWKARPGGFESEGYHYAREQLKSIRQDLTVQHIRDKLAVETYETHARVALEVGDGAEFTACHTRLKRLYAEGVEGNREEFIAYGLLLAQSTAGIGRGKGVLAGANLVSELSDASHDESCFEHPFVSHALAVSRAFRQGDFHEFGALYAKAPRMSPYLMDKMLPRMRTWALQSLQSAYKPMPVPLDIVSKALSCNQDGTLVDCLVESMGGRVDRKNGVMETSTPSPWGFPGPSSGLKVAPGSGVKAKGGRGASPRQPGGGRGKGAGVKSPTFASRALGGLQLGVQLQTKRK